MRHVAGMLPTLMHLTAMFGRVAGGWSGRESIEGYYGNWLEGGDIGLCSLPLMLMKLMTDL